MAEGLELNDLWGPFQPKPFHDSMKIKYITLDEKKQENSPFPLQLLRTCEKGIFLICFQSQPFRGMLQLMIRKPAGFSLSCGVVFLHKFSFGALSYTVFLLDWWLNAATCYPNRIVFANFVLTCPNNHEARDLCEINSRTRFPSLSKSQHL